MCKFCWIKHFGKEIPKVSTKMKNRLSIYYKLREEYLKNNPICEVCKVKKSTEIHHKRGRNGPNLFLDFLAVDRDCHIKIETEPEWAKQNNYTITRI